MTADPRALDYDPGRVVRPDTWVRASLHSPVSSLQDEPSCDHLTVAAVMTAPAHVAGPAAPLYEIVDRMLTLGQNEIVVVVGNRPQGVLTERHLEAILHPAPHGRARRATDLLPPGLPTLLPNTQIAAAAAIMTGERVEALAVVDGNGSLLGVVSHRQLVGHLADGTSP